jgi:hypothetical protein
VHLAKAKAATYDTPTFHDALIRDDADLWKEAITKEINTLKERGTWELVERPQNARVLPSKVVLKSSGVLMAQPIAIRQDLLLWDFYRGSLIN